MSHFEADVEGNEIKKSCPMKNDTEKIMIIHQLSNNSTMIYHLLLHTDIHSYGSLE